MNGRYLVIMPILAAVVSCTMFSNQSKLDDRVSETVQLEDIEVTVHRMGFLEAGWKCAKRANIPAWLHPVIVQIFGCATVKYKNERVVRCEIIVGVDWAYVLEHELNHCSGLDD